MSDRVEKMINSRLGKRLQRSLGVTVPAELQRYTADQPGVPSAPVLFGAGDNGQCLAATIRVIGDMGAALVLTPECAAQVGGESSAGAADERYSALVFDGSGFSDGLELVQAYRFFHSNIRKLQASGRIVILARPHQDCATPEAAAAQRALEGLSRSLAKEVGGRGSTAQLLSVAEGAEANLDSSLRFLLSPKSAYISGQVIRVQAAAAEDNPQWDKPLAGKTALVTGASRGIGAAIAATLTRDGATVIGVDLEPMAAELQQLMQSLQGKPLLADITSPEAPETILHAVRELGGVDLVVHNAGVTRDKTIANMPEQHWQMTLDINLAAAQRINAQLLQGDAINAGGSIVGVSSMNGIAGQRGQTNYAASKAGVIGYVEQMARSGELAARGITVNAVAPGFIETAMTASIPLLPRLLGRRLNSLAQAGQPVDVAEAIAFLGSPNSRGVNGNILRVCGQAWFGA